MINKTQSANDRISDLQESLSDTEDKKCKRLEGSREAWKLALMTSGTALLAALLAAIISQKINAAVETSKVVRTKLEEAYFRSQNLPRYAIDLNGVAVTPVQVASADRALHQYEIARSRYADEVSYIVTIVDLFEEPIEGPAQALKACSTKYADRAAEYFLTSYQLKERNLTNTPFSPVQLNELVTLRTECETATIHLQKAIKKDMKRHLSYWPL